jgi:multiple antibiotic resistance protein
LDFATYLKTFLGLLAIVDPFIAVPMFLALTPEYGPKDRKQVARIAAVTVFCVLTAALLIGAPLLATGVQSGRRSDSIYERDLEL